MAVTTVDYGTFKSHSGILTEVCGAIAGKPANRIKGFTYDPNSNVYVVIEGK